MVPWNARRNHWTLYIFDSTRKIIEFYDSLGGNGLLDELSKIAKCLKVGYIKNACNISLYTFKKHHHFYFQKRCIHFKDVNLWQKDFNPSRIRSRQTNDYDCWVHVIKVMQKLYRNPLAEIEQFEHNFPEYRNRICLEILDHHDSAEEQIE